MRKLLALAPLLAAACTTMANETPPISDGQCRSEGLDAFVGREPTPEVGSEIIAKSGAKVFRWLVPGQIVTMEFRADRLNIVLDDAGKVSAIRCG